MSTTMTTEATAAITSCFPALSVDDATAWLDLDSFGAFDAQDFDLSKAAAFDMGVVDVDLVDVQFATEAMTPTAIKPEPEHISSASSSASSDCDEDDVDVENMTKDELRKHKNRESAARSRKRTRARMEELEGLVRELEAKNRRLEQAVHVLHYGRVAAPMAMPMQMQAPLPVQQHSFQSQLHMPMPIALPSYM